MLLILGRIEEALSSLKFVNLEKTAAFPSNSTVNSNLLNICQGKVSLGGRIPQLDSVSTSISNVITVE